MSQFLDSYVRMIVRMYHACSMMSEVVEVQTGWLVRYAVVVSTSASVQGLRTVASGEEWVCEEKRQHG